MNRRFLITLAVCAIFALANTGVTAAPKTPRAAVKAPSTATATQTLAASAGVPTLDAQDLQTFFAGLVPYALKRNDIAGGVIAVVKNGQLIFSQGYGYADLKTRAPVIADQTLFRVGSVSKLFTWTAVMQQVQADKINLDADVNQYLDFKIPPAYGQPITMRELMTHTAGFAETIRDLFFPTTEQLFPIRTYLMDRMPPRIFPPGKIVAYSNYGATLAAYIVQRVSGEPFDKYVATHIFKPLGMDHSTFVQPLPAALQPDMSVGYITASRGPVIPFEAVEVAPAGSMSSTATDMAHFMIAQLQNGSYNGVQILSPATVALMHSPQYRAAPDMNGFDLGFYQENRNGQQIIGHAGDTNAFHTDLHLITDADVGIFMSFNSTGKNGAVEKMRVALFRAFLDRYFPYTPPQEKTVADPQRDAARVAGWYLGSRRENSALALLFLLGQDHVSALPNGEIEDTMPFLADEAGTPKRWREVGPLNYREVNGQAHLKFVAAPDGRIRYWVSDDFIPVELFQRVSGLRQLSLLKNLTLISIVVFILTVLIWIIGAAVRRRFQKPLVLTATHFKLRLASRIGVLLQLAVVVGWLLFIAVLSQPTANLAGLVPGLAVLYVLGVLGVLGGIAIIIEALWRITRGPGWLLCRLGEALLGLCALYGIWMILACGLANFNFQF